MSKYSMDWDCGDDERLPEWLVCETIMSKNGSAIARIVFHSTVEEEAQCMLEELQINEMAAEIDYYRDQQSEFDLYGDNAMEADYV